MNENKVTFENEQHLEGLKKFGTPHACWLMREYVKPGKCLDLGAGEGERTKFFFSKNNDVVASDFSQGALKRLKDRGYTPAFADLNKFPFPFKTNEFDNLLMFGILEHLYTPYLAMEEVHRILKPGGRFFIMVPDAKNQKITPVHYYYYSYTGIKLMLNRAGFKRVKRFFNGVISPQFTKLTNSIPFVKKMFPSDLYLVAFKD